jgi:hypothetical protein
MKQHKQPRYLTWSEYVSSDQSQNTEIAGARFAFMEVVWRVFPRFFEQLRALVYPNYAQLNVAGSNHDRAGGAGHLHAR